MVMQPFHGCIKTQIWAEDQLLSTPPVTVRPLLVVFRAAHWDELHQDRWFQQQDLTFVQGFQGMAVWWSWPLDGAGQGLGLI